MALFRTLPTPTYDLLPRLMVEVCLVLAPDVNFFLDSRKQGLPCWRSLFFSFLSQEAWGRGASYLIQDRGEAKAISLAGIVPSL